MLKQVQRCAPVMLVVLMLSACGPAPQMAAGPVSVEAGYRLMFNDALVGDALFILQIGADGAYRIEAFTTPAGQMRRAEGHEVLESSQGVIDSEGVRPRRFDHSVMADEQIESVKLVFDHERNLLRIVDRQVERTVALAPSTQDHLSYLLTAQRLAMKGEGATEIQIASKGSTEQTQLQVVGPESIDVPLGHYETIAIQRVTSKPDEIRALWFDTGLSPLPVRVVHGWAGNTVDMQLESLTRQ
jgi:hypothetical protein